MAIIQHGDYVARIDYDPELGSFHGRVVNLRDVVTFYGRSVEELRAEFSASLQAYEEFCRAKGLEPARPFSGRFNLRLGPELHRRVAAAAAKSGKSLNAWATEVLDRAASA